MSAQYEPDGDFVSLTGDHAVGHGAIEAFYEPAFETGYAGSAATATAVHARALSSTFALIGGYWTIQPPENKDVRARLAIIGIGPDKAYADTRR